MGAERPEDLAREGLEHLQAAAREVIVATRRLLDAAEEVIDDPQAVQGLAGGIAAMARAAAARLRGDDDSDGGDGPVEHIPVS